MVRRDARFTFQLSASRVLLQINIVDTVQLNVLHCVDYIGVIQDLIKHRNY